jgi:steroid delta-isomerase-like uncharacterized protein
MNEDNYSWVMSAEDNKAIARRWFELVNAREPEGLRSLLHPDLVDHTPLLGAAPDADGQIAVATVTLHAFPDIHVTVEDMLAEDDRVAVRISIRGTHRGTLMGRYEPTGRQVFWTGMDFFRIADSKIAEVWRLRDVQALISQLEGTT